MYTSALFVSNARMKFERDTSIDKMRLNSAGYAWAWGCVSWPIWSDGATTQPPH